MERKWNRAVHVVALLVCWAGAILVVDGREKVYRKTFLSPTFETAPGNVFDRFYNIELPKGHIVIRSLHSDMVDADSGEPIPLTDLYLHHWVMLSAVVKKGFKELLSSVPLSSPSSVRHALHSHGERMAFRPEAEPVKGLLKFEGICSKEESANQVFGAGAESRHTNFTVPAPYGFVIGDSAGIPQGYEEAWYVNLHSIDLRGVVDLQGCSECVCDLYNATVDRFGHPLSKDYRGGLLCCYDKMNCAVKPGFSAKPRRAQMKYTISWVEWDKSVRPLRSYIMDVTDSRASIFDDPQCKTEYEVPKCAEGTASENCIDARLSIGGLPKGGDLILAFCHQHAGGLGSRIINEAGVNICESTPIYGQGSEAGNEAGWVTGMTSCNPEPGSVKIRTMEELRVEAEYSSLRARTGVMSIFNVFIADPIDELEPLEVRVGEVDIVE